MESPTSSSRVASSNREERSSLLDSTPSISSSCSPRQPTVVVIPPSEEEYGCRSFSSEEEYERYVQSISPRRELVCPITQELLQDPVVAEDGHTYERTAILRWFHHMGRTRSPVTNSLMSANAKNNLVPNLAIQGMAMSHREKLGVELLKRCEVIWRRTRGRCDDGGMRVRALLDNGADVTMRCKAGGDTALLMMIQASNLSLSIALLHHDSPVQVTNNSGLSCIQAAQNAADNAAGMEAKMEWKEFVEELKRREILEKEKEQRKHQERNRSNEEHRERQRSLAAEARAMAEASRGRGAGNSGRGLGDLEDGWGYFPSLAALQFQSSIPPPSASIAEHERKERRRLEVILRFVGFVVIFCWLLS